MWRTFHLEDGVAALKTSEEPTLDKTRFEHLALIMPRFWVYLRYALCGYSRKAFTTTRRPDERLAHHHAWCASRHSYYLLDGCVLLCFRFLIIRFFSLLLYSVMSYTRDEFRCTTFVVVYNVGVEGVNATHFCSDVYGRLFGDN
jgi:hypothetical protein